MSDEQKRIAASIGVPVARRHIFLCCDQTTPKCCDKERGLVAWEFLKRRLKELGLSDQGGILRTKANCLRIVSAGTPPARPGVMAGLQAESARLTDRLYQLLYNSCSMMSGGFTISGLSFT
jgi:hypothetical protein